MNSPLTILCKAASNGRRVFSFKLVVILLLVGLASFTTELVFDDFIPNRFDRALISIGSYAVLSLPMVAVMNRLFFALERIGIRLYLKKLSAQEAEVLSQFSTTRRMVDVALDPESSQVKQLVELNLITPDTGLSFMGGDKQSTPHAYYSMATWVFYHLLRNPVLLEIHERNEEETRD